MRPRLVENVGHHVLEPEAVTRHVLTEHVSKQLGRATFNLMPSGAA